jgi:hypothetical protein
MKLSLLHEDEKLKSALQRIYGMSMSGLDRARLHQAKHFVGIGKNAEIQATTGQAGRFATDAGIPSNPRHRKFFGIKEG